MNRRATFRKFFFADSGGFTPPPSSKAGFTIIELLVSLSIIVFLGAIVLFNIGQQRQRAALLHSGQRLTLDLRRTQNFALSAREFQITGVPCGWGIHFNGPNSANYIIFADLAASPDCSDRDFIRAANGSEDYETVNFDAGISINSLSNSLSDIVFTPPDPLVRFTPDQTTAAVVLINRNSATMTATVNKAGLIFLQ